MELEVKNQEKNDDKKNFIIYVNAEEKQWHEKNISFEQVAALAFGKYEDNPDITYSITYKRGNDNQPEGQLTKGQSVHVKDKMRFNATRTNKS